MDASKGFRFFSTIWGGLGLIIFTGVIFALLGSASECAIFVVLIWAIDKVEVVFEGIWVDEDFGGFFDVFHEDKVNDAEAVD